MKLATSTTWTELLLLLIAFVLSMIIGIERQLRQKHIDRLHEGLRESIDTSSLHLDLLANLKRANSLAAGIAYAVLGRHRVTDDDA